MLGQTLQLTALFYLNQGRLEESEATYGEALALFRAINPKHFEIGKCNNGLALIASRRGDYAKAEKTLEEVEVLFREVLGEKHPFTWQVRGNRASQIGLQGRLEEAEAIETRGRREDRGAQRHGILRRRSTPASRLAETRRRRGHPEVALPVHREALAAVVKMEGESSTWAAMLRFQVAADLLASGRAEDRAEARALLDSALAVLEKQSPPPQRLAEVQALRRSAG